MLIFLAGFPERGIPLDINTPINLKWCSERETNNRIPKTMQEAKTLGTERRLNIPVTCECYGICHGPPNNIITNQEHLMVVFRNDTRGQNKAGHTARKEKPGTTEGALAQRPGWGPLRSEADGAAFSVGGLATPAVGRCNKSTTMNNDDSKRRNNDSPNCTPQRILPPGPPGDTCVADAFSKTLDQN